MGAAVTEEQYKLNMFYEDLCNYFSSNYNPDMHVDYENAKIAWDGFRSCIDSINAKAVVPLEQYQQMKLDEGTIEGTIEGICKEQLCYKLAEYFMNNLDESIFFSKETDSNGDIWLRVRFNFINPERLKEVKL